LEMTKKITQILFLIFLALFVVSCEEGCVDPDEFDVQTTLIESKPVADGIYGTYDPLGGGQRVDWHDTGFKSNGDRFLMYISGKWAPLMGDTMNASTLAALPRCNFCAKKHGQANMNCMCYDGQSPAPENGPGGNPISTDCSTAANQNDPAKCTCTTLQGSVLGYGAYHFPLNILNKDETVKSSDRQTNCKFDRGMGAYIALWGSRGTNVPLRAYHLFSQEEICSVKRNSDGQCVDDSGNDITRYEIISPNSRIFMKDDKNDNNGTDTNTADDEYHTPNEVIKHIMWDQYYSDNYGQYNLHIIRGVGNRYEPGLIEYLVGIVEDVLIGPVGDDGKRSGGILEFMYKAIVKDSGFVMAVHVSLILYIALFGAAHLFGVVEMNKKEVLNRILKIGLIVFFTSGESWYFYNKIVVAFFKDSMDYVVAMIMDLSDANQDPSSMTIVAQMDRTTATSSATRFSYVDLMIRNLMSLAVAKKILGLFFFNLFGFLYLPLIYALIGFFIYVMLFVASMYIINVIKIVFVLALGPIFMVFTLFTKTANMFKNWLAFLGARSLEIIIMFTVLYFFLNILDRNFNDLFYYRACGESHSLGLFSIIIYHSYIDRTFIDWMTRFVTIAGLIFITKMMVEKAMHIAGSLISIGGVANKGGDGKGHGESGAALAGSMMGNALGLAKGAASHLGHAAATAGRYGVRGLTLGARTSGIADKFNALGDKIPFRGPRSKWRDSIIDGAIKRAESVAGARSGAARDKFIREAAMKELQAEMYNNPNKMGFLGVDMHNISKRFDQKLVKEPLKNFLKAEAKKLKKQDPGKVLFGKEMREALRNAATNWADKNFYGGAREKVGEYLATSAMKDLVRSEGELSSSQAAKHFAGNEELKNRYLQHLKDNEARLARKRAEAGKHWYTQIPNALGRAKAALLRDSAHNPKMMQSSFFRKVGYEEKDQSSASRRMFGISPSKGWNPLKRINILDKALHRKAITAQTDAANRKAIASRLASDKSFTSDAKPKTKKEQRRAEREQQKRRFLQNQMRTMATRDIADQDPVLVGAKLIDDLTRNDGRSLFEKTARLDAAFAGEGRASAQIVLSQMIAEKFSSLAGDVRGDNITAQQALQMREQLGQLRSSGIYSSSALSGQMKWEFLARWRPSKDDALLKAANNEATKKLLENIANDTLDKDVKTIAKNAGELDKAIVEKSAERRAEVDKADAELEGKIKNIANLSAAEKEGALKAIKTEYGLVAQKFEVEFGQSVTDALLKQADIGLKASNIVLGVAPKEDGKIDPATVNAMKINSNQIHGKLKLSKMNLKIKQFELEQKKTAGADKHEIVAMEQEIKELERDVGNYETEVERIDLDIKNVDK